MTHTLTDAQSLTITDAQSLTIADALTHTLTASAAANGASEMRYSLETPFVRSAAEDAWGHSRHTLSASEMRYSPTSPTALC